MGDGVEFTFDPGPFLSGLNRAASGLSGLLGKADGLEKKITSGVGKAMNGLIGKVGLLVAGFKAAGAVLKEMPEVGMTFGIAKDVFLKNLLWPLRQQVMPALQRMLDWVRDNRAAFVRWGVAVANIFRTVAVVAGTLWDVFKELVKTVADSFQRAFVTNFKSFDEFLNVLSFKVSAVIIYMGMLAKDLITNLKPAIDWVIDMGEEVLSFFFNLGKNWTELNEQGNSLGTVLEAMGRGVKTIAEFIQAAARGFSEGFVPATRNAMTPLQSIVDTFNRLLAVLGLKDTDGIRGAFKSLGEILGTALVGTLNTIATLFDGLVTALGTLGALAKVVAAIFEGDWTKVSAEWKSVGPMWDEFMSRTKGTWGSIQPQRSSGAVHDAIITKTGDVIRTDPDDNLYAFKSLGGRGGGGVTLQVHNEVHVSASPGDAERVGYEFMAGLARGGSALADALAQSRVAEGY